MPGSANPGFDTLAVHAGAAPDPATGARAVPIHLSTAFVFESSEHAASLFNMERSGHVYSRISNPTNAVLEERIAALEGGSHNLLAYTLPRFGIETTFVKPGDLGAWRAALRPNTKLLFGESLG